MTIVARILTHVARAGIAYGLGTTTGILIFLTLATVSLSMLASEMGFGITVLRYAGAAWLIWTGIKLWTTTSVAGATRQGRPNAGLFAGYLTGIALNLSNPKMPLFHIALLPNIVARP